MFKETTASKNWMKRECGAFWAKEGQIGRRFWSGYIELDKIEIPEDKKVNIVLFKNDTKGNDTAPVLRAYIGKEHMLKEVEVVQNDESNGLDDGLF